MRDGVKLFTSSTCRRTSRRSIRSCEPHAVQRRSVRRGQVQRRASGPRAVREGRLHLRLSGRPRPLDVRGRVRRRAAGHREQSKPRTIDEATDTYDTIDWLVKNVPNNNGKVGTCGISYPGFYTAAGMIDAHPALKAARRRRRSPTGSSATTCITTAPFPGAEFLFFTFRPTPGADQDPKYIKPWNGANTQDGYDFFLRRRRAERIADELRSRASASRMQVLGRDDAASELRSVLERP